jgi:signal transduction histidine kinase
LGFGASNSFCLGISGKIYLRKAQETTNKNLRRNNLLQALKYTNESLETDKSLGNTKEISEDYLQISEIQVLMEDFKSALASYQTAIVYKDSVFNSDNRETIKNLEDKRKIDLRDRAIKINKMALETKERQKWYLVFGLALLGIIGCLLFYQSNNRRKTNRKLNLMNTELGQANKLKTRLLGILNHDLRSPVNSFIHFIQFQKENPELLDTETKTRIENTTLASAKNLLNSMEDILLWTKDQMENFEPQPKFIKIASLFEETKNHFSAVESIRFIFEDAQNTEVFCDENYLKTIARNLTGNAIKALSETENPTISWKAWEKDGKKFLSISDNGPGAKEEQFRALYDDREISGIQSGLGLHLIRDLAKAIGSEITMKTEEGSGTQFTLSFQ